MMATNKTVDDPAVVAEFEAHQKQRDEQSSDQPPIWMDLNGPVDRRYQLSRADIDYACDELQKHTPHKYAKGCLLELLNDVLSQIPDFEHHAHGIRECKATELRAGDEIWIGDSVGPGGCWAYILAVRNGPEVKIWWERDQYDDSDEISKLEDDDTLLVRIGTDT